MYKNSEVIILRGTRNLSLKKFLLRTNKKLFLFFFFIKFVYSSNSVTILSIVLETVFADNYAC